MSRVAQQCTAVLSTKDRQESRSIDHRAKLFQVEMHPPDRASDPSQAVHWMDFVHFHLCQAKEIAQRGTCLNLFSMDHAPLDRANLDEHSVS